MDFEKKLFHNKSYSDLLTKIYKSADKKEKEISVLIDSLKPLVTDNQSALVIVPLIASYLGISVKNDDSLIRMAAILQRAAANSSGEGEGDFILSESDKEQLMAEVKNVTKPVVKHEQSKE